VGVNVELRQHGPQPRKGRAKTTLVEQIGDRDDLFVGLLNNVYNTGRTPTLDRIDPYGTVVLSGADVTRLLAELPILCQRPCECPHWWPSNVPTCGRVRS
jgi:hypothetical protein